MIFVGFTYFKAKNLKVEYDCCVIAARTRKTQSYVSNVAKMAQSNLIIKPNTMIKKGTEKRYL